MSDTENNERIANRRSGTVSRGAAKRTKRKRTTRASFKLRGRREKRTPAAVVKYEEIEDEVEEKLSDEEGADEGEKDAEDTEFKVEEEGQGANEEEEEGEEEELVEALSDDNENSSVPSTVRNLRNKKTVKAPISFTAKKRGPSSKFSSLMKRSRKQARTYEMQFNRKDSASVSPVAVSSAKLSSEDGDDQVNTQLLA